MLKKPQLNVDNHVVPAPIKLHVISIILNQLHACISVNKAEEELVKQEALLDNLVGILFLRTLRMQM